MVYAYHIKTVGDKLERRLEEFDLINCSHCPENVPRIPHCSTCGQEYTHLKTITSGERIHQFLYTCGCLNGGDKNAVASLTIEIDPSREDIRNYIETHGSIPKYPVA